MWELTEDDVDGVDVRALEPGTTLIVETHNSRYRLVILFDPSVVLVKGGAMFGDQAIVRLVGATIGRTTVKVGWILVGLRIEMWLGSMCITSSPVLSVSVESVPPPTWQSLVLN